MGALAGLAAVLLAGGGRDVGAAAAWLGAACGSFPDYLMSPEFELTVAAVTAGLAALYAVDQAVEG